MDAAARIDDYSEVGILLVEEAEAYAKAHLPAELYHYTSFNGLKGIVESNEIWATSAKHLNDSTEVSYGYELLKEVSRSFTNISTESRTFLNVLSEHGNPFGFGLDFFSTSFCEQPDLLSQWKGYASSEGYSLGFKLENFSFAIPKAQADFVRAGGIYKVEYNKDAAWDRLRQFLESFMTALDANVATGRDPATEVIAAASAAVGTAVTLFLGMKHPAFAEESEWRIVVALDPVEGRALVKKRAGTASDIDYISLPVRTGDDPHGLLPICGVLIGPRVTDSNAETSLRSILQSKAHPAIPIKRSSIPFR